MKKYLFTILGVCLVFLITIWIGRAMVVSSVLSHKLKVALSLEKIDFSKGHWNIYKLRLENPKGFHPKYAFLTEKMDILFPKANRLIPSAIIENLKLERAVLNIDCSNAFCTKNNWTSIMGKAQKKEKTKEGGMQIQVVDLVDFTVNIEGLGIGNSSKNLHFDHLVLKDLSSEKGFPVEILIQELFKSAGIDEYLQGVKKVGKGLFKKIF